MTLGTYIKVKFGTQDKLDEVLMLKQNTVNRWYNNDPKKLFTHVQQLAKFGDSTAEEVIRMIEERCDDVKHLQSIRK